MNRRAVEDENATCPEDKQSRMIPKRCRFCHWSGSFLTPQSNWGPLDGWWGEWVWADMCDGASLGEKFLQQLTFSSAVQSVR